MPVNNRAAQCEARFVKYSQHNHHKRRGKAMNALNRHRRAALIILKYKGLIFARLKLKSHANNYNNTRSAEEIIIKGNKMQTKIKSYARAHTRQGV